MATINSKAAGRLLAAGGIYNGNVEDFKKTAEKLGGHALEGYNQLLNEKTAGIALAAASLLLARRPGNYKEMSNYLGRLRGESKLLKGIIVKEINYVRRDPAEVAILRKEFNRNVRKKFVTSLAETKDAAKSFRPFELMKMSEGRIPEGWSVHHKLPLDDSGTNTFDNLTLIKNEPFHKIFTNMQSSVTKGMSTGKSKKTLWAMPNDAIYPLK